MYRTICPGPMRLWRCVSHRLRHMISPRIWSRGVAIRLHRRSNRLSVEGYLAIPDSEPETALISDKMHTAGLGLDDVISQIRKRYAVYEKNIYELEWAKCEAINCLYRHRGYHGPTDSKIEYSVSKRLNDLYMEQRAERVNLWRDVSRLRLQLPENAQQYLSAHRKVSILQDDEGDAP